MEIGAYPCPGITGTTVSKRIAAEMVDHYNRHDKTRLPKRRRGASAAGIIAALWLGGASMPESVSPSRPRCSLASDPVCSALTEGGKSV
jgi:hypothetical protein